MSGTGIVWGPGEVPQDRLGICLICTGDAEECAQVGHEWIRCPRCQEETRPSYALCPTCRYPEPEDTGE